MKNSIYKLILLTIASFIIFIFIFSCNNESDPEFIVQTIKLTNTDETLEASTNIGKLSKTMSVVYKDFKLINNTGKEITISYALTDCGCTIGVIEDKKNDKSIEFSNDKEPKIADIILNDSESVIIHAKMDISNEEKGSKEQYLEIYNDYSDLIAKINIMYEIEE